MSTLSPSKKFEKAKYRLLKGSGVTVVTIIMLAMCVMMIVAVVCDFLSEDDSYNGIIVFLMDLMIFPVIIIFMQGISPNKISLKVKAKINGNASMYDMMIQFPIKKSDVLRYNEKVWSLSMLVPVLIMLLYNSVLLFDERAVEAKGEIAFATLFVLASVILSAWFMFLGVNISGESSGKIRRVVFWILYCIFMCTMLFNKTKVFISIIDAVRGFSGIIAIVVLALIIPVICLLTEVFVIRKKGREAWHYEETE